MNIRVDLNTNIADGSEVVFRSPADCSQVTGLAIYHTGGRTEFAFADAHGHNVGDIDHLFAENAVVKVILDVTAGMAFVQNADTNAYIESTFVKSVNGVKPDANGNVEVDGDEGLKDQEYEEETRLDIRNMIEKGCFLLSSTGLPSNKTAAMVDAGYAMIAVSPGERYRISTYIPTTSGIIFYAEDGIVVSVDEGGKTGANVRVKDYEITVPEGCATMGVSTRKRTSDPIIVKRVQVKPMTPQVIGEALTEQKSACAEDENNDDDRMYALENLLGFSFKGLDKGKVIFMTDGTRSILSDVYAVFQNHGMVMSVAPVYSGVVTNPVAMNDNSTPLEFLHRVQEDGGEIFAHSMNGDALTPENAEEMLRESKRWLTEEGFDIHGWIAPRGIFCPEARRLYHKYYRYGYRASDKAGSPLNFPRPYLSELGLEGAKAALEACERDKSVLVLFHHWSDNELEGFNLEDLEALLSYIETKAVDVTTYRDCFFNYGSFGATSEGKSGGGIEVSGAEVGQFLKVAEVDENGVPTAWTTGEGGSNQKWELLVDFTAAEDYESVSFTEDMNGNPFDLSEAFCTIHHVTIAGATKYGLNAVMYDISKRYSGSEYPHYNCHHMGLIYDVSCPLEGYTMTNGFHVKSINDDILSGVAWTGKNTNSQASQTSVRTIRGVYTGNEYEGLGKLISLHVSSLEKNVGAGTKIKLWGVRK